MVVLHMVLVTIARCCSFYSTVAWSRVLVYPLVLCIRAGPIAKRMIRQWHEGQWRGRYGRKMYKYSSRVAIIVSPVSNVAPRLASQKMKRPNGKGAGCKWAKWTGKWASQWFGNKSPHTSDCLAHMGLYFLPWRCLSRYPVLHLLRNRTPTQCNATVSTPPRAF